jgi:putative membrane protein
MVNSRPMQKAITSLVSLFLTHSKSSITEADVNHRDVLLRGLLGWYVLFSIIMAISPADRQFWVAANVLPILFVGFLVGTRRFLPLSNTAYVLITLYLTLHTIGVHYTYSKVPLGMWLGQLFDLHRNHFDRIVHFCFGLLLTYPVLEAFSRVTNVRGWLLYYLSFITPLGLSGLWEIIESWVARFARPELGLTFLGSQGDVWDAQKDMAAAMYGAILCIALTAIVRKVGTGMNTPALVEVEPDAPLEQMT